MPRGYPKNGRSRDWHSREGHYGEANGNNNWSDKHAKMIREYRAEGFTYHDLRMLFGGNDNTLSALCYGRSYKTAGGPIAGKDYPARKHGRSIL